MKKYQKYEHLKISVAQLIQRILTSHSWALQGNAFIEGSIIKTPVGKAEGEIVYQQFEVFRNQIRDLGLCSA